MKFTLGSVVIVYSHDAVYRHTSIDIETTIYKVFFLNSRSSFLGNAAGTT